MATAVVLDASPISFVRSLRGAIVGARIAYPDVVHLDVRDSRGDVWRLASQDATCSPADPSRLLGLSIEDAQIDEAGKQLRCLLSDGSSFVIRSAPAETEDDPPNWELINPAGVVLEFGPGLRWRFSGLSSRVSSDR